mmetsp:Transcript_91772/g.259829  ORF Transcript_91772/g.259829 Transcript_91772/m.259829 type:complete len:203 (+) Transcript_91772:97-705(+)
MNVQSGPPCQRPSSPILFTRGASSIPAPQQRKVLGPSCMPVQQRCPPCHPSHSLLSSGRSCGSPVPGTHHARVTARLPARTRQRGAQRQMNCSASPWQTPGARPPAPSSEPTCRDPRRRRSPVEARSYRTPGPPARWCSSGTSGPAPPAMSGRAMPGACARARAHQRSPGARGCANASPRHARLSPARCSSSRSHPPPPRSW